MNTTISGANMRHSHRSGSGLGHRYNNHGHHDSKSDLPGVLSVLELRRLVAAMVD